MGAIGVKLSPSPSKLRMQFFFSKSIMYTFVSVDDAEQSSSKGRFAASSSTADTNLPERTTHRSNHCICIISVKAGRIQYRSSVNDPMAVYDKGCAKCEVLDDARRGYVSLKKGGKHSLAPSPAGVPEGQCPLRPIWGKQIMEERHSQISSLKSRS